MSSNHLGKTFSRTVPLEIDYSPRCRPRPPSHHGAWSQCKKNHRVEGGNREKHVKCIQKIENLEFRSPFEDVARERSRGFTQAQTGPKALRRFNCTVLADPSSRSILLQYRDARIKCMLLLLRYCVPVDFRLYPLVCFNMEP